MFVAISSLIVAFRCQLHVKLPDKFACMKGWIDSTLQADWKGNARMLKAHEYVEATMSRLQLLFPEQELKLASKVLCVQGSSDMAHWRLGDLEAWRQLHASPCTLKTFQCAENKNDWKPLLPQIQRLVSSSHVGQDIFGPSLVPLVQESVSANIGEMLRLLPRKAPMTSDVVFAMKKDIIAAVGEVEGVAKLPRRRKITICYRGQLLSGVQVK